MKRIILTAMVALLSAGITLAHAGAQQEKMKTCNAEAKGKKGDERKAFMKECLSAKSNAPTPAAAPAPVEKKTAQQDKMKDCNAEAKGKTGNERKAFMKECLSTKKEAPAAAPAPVDKKAAQQDKMKSCNKEAGDKKLKGDERKKFMSDCLKG